MSLILGTTLYLCGQAAIVSGLPGGLIFCGARWILKRGGRPARIVLTLLLPVLGAGIAYGILRLSGLILFPDDNTYSSNFFDASWRDDGIALMLVYGGPFTGIAAALWAGRRAERQRREEDTSNVKQPDGAG